MKRNISVVTFNEPEHESTLMLHYYESIRKNIHIPGSGWSIDGKYSTDVSPQTTPHPSPRAKNKSMRTDNAMDGVISQFSSMLSHEISTQHSSFQGLECCFPSMASLPPSTLSTSSTLLSFKSNNSTQHDSTEEPTIVRRAKTAKSKPIDIKKKKGRRAVFANKG